MTLMKWDPFRDLIHYHQRLTAPLTGENDSFGSWIPPVDVFENGDDLIIRAEVPGLDRKDIDIRVEDNRLVIQGERKRESEFDEEAAYRLERSFGAFTRSFLLPKTVDAGRIGAAYRDGVLEVRLPKTEVAKPRKIEISAA